MSGYYKGQLASSIYLSSCSPVVSIVRAHDSENVGISNTSLERRSVVLRQVLVINDSVETVALIAFPVLDVIADVMLASGSDTRVLIGSLETGDELTNIL
jgi:hypothetical protein